jgi:hypothetical protein
VHERAGRAVKTGADRQTRRQTGTLCRAARPAPAPSQKRRESNVGNVAFLFPGQESAAIGMGEASPSVGRAAQGTGLAGAGAGS